MRSSTSSRSRPLPADPAELVRRLLARDRAAVPEALNLVDDRRPERLEVARRFLEQLERELPFPGAARIGVTGAPGSGKSTLLDALVRSLRPRGATLAIVAVDPSSRRSGGALLGDRARVRSAALDPGVFIRSMAARERLGGLADATRAAVSILAAGFDRVFVETVGVGQSEAEVGSVVDSVVFVANPGSGDLIQFMKAGVMEEPDVFVVNKADVGPEATRTAAELESAVALAEPRDADWRPPLVLASALRDEGVDALLDALDAHRGHLETGGRLLAQRRRGAARYVLATLDRRYGSFGLEQIGGRDAVESRLASEEPMPGFACITALGREIEAALGR